MKYEEITKESVLRFYDSIQDAINHQEIILSQRDKNWTEFVELTYGRVFSQEVLNISTNNRPVYQQMTVFIDNIKHLLAQQINDTKGLIVHLKTLL